MKVKKSILLFLGNSIQSSFQSSFKFFIIFNFILITVFNPTAEAKRRPKKINTAYDRNPAQVSETSDTEEGDDAYDPFADYSEFEYETNEQADVNFFRNGRMLNIGLNGGYNMYLGNLGEKVQNGFKYGFFIAYFFDMHFALQFNYLMGDYPMAFQAPDSILTGTGSFTTMSFSTKYYTHTQNVTRGFAQLNPYFIFGFSNQYKTLIFDGIPGNVKQAAMGFDFGAGIEVPMLRKKMFWGLQSVYHHVNFKDSARDFIYDGKNYGNQVGDNIDILGLVGFNF